MEKILFQSFDEINQIYDLDKKSSYVIDVTPKTCGWYKVIEDKVSAIYAFKGQIHLIYNKIQISLNQTMNSKIKNKNGIQIFTLKNNNLPILTFEYSSENSLKGVEPFDYIDDEDYDWGLFLSNIINNVNRQHLFIKLNE